MMAFEAAHGRSISDNMPTTDMMWMAYRAIKGFNPKGDKDLTEWAEGIEDIDLVTDEATNGALAPEGKAELAQQSS